MRAFNRRKKLRKHWMYSKKDRGIILSSKRESFTYGGIHYICEPYSDTIEAFKIIKCGDK